MRNFTSYYEMEQADVSRTYWEEGNRVYVRYITKDKNIKEEICPDSIVEQVRYSKNETYFQVKTKRNTFHQAQTIEEINYIASIANLFIVFLPD